jgi:hypothetical protein
MLWIEYVISFLNHYRRGYFQYRRFARVQPALSEFPKFLGRIRREPVAGQTIRVHGIDPHVVQNGRAPKDRCGDPTAAPVVERVFQDRERDARGCVDHGMTPEGPSAVGIQSAESRENLILISNLSQAVHRNRHA